MDYPIKGFIETSFSDWPGKVVAVLFLPFCDFRCLYCHNHELVLTPEKYPDFPLREIVERLRERRGWIDGVCLTGGEPTLHPWLPSLIRDLKSAHGLASAGVSLGIKLDTNGTRPEILQNLIAEGLLDYVALDLKAPLEATRYARVAGVPLGEDLIARIQSSIQILLKDTVDHEFRTTLVPALIEEEEIYALARRIKGARRYTLQKFNPRHTLDKTLRSAQPFDEQTLRRMQERVNEIIK
ncbi:MAG: anaerobic ribonucleoside-triphosphate reductase activating protein [Thermodesulfobacteriota bacterium]|nr:anaerobic ribonucleoside-triphosphate reductase activating protein [Thermodesulfobacteriota bacterium]